MKFLPLASLVVALAVSACNSAAPPPTAQAAPPPPDPATLGVAAGPTGAALTLGDRRAAGEAQFMAVETGRVRSWRGKDGGYGIVEPGPEGQRAEGACREYVHKIYVDGRPKSGTGLACKSPAGQWRIVG